MCELNNQIISEALAEFHSINRYELTEVAVAATQDGATRRFPAVISYLGEVTPVMIDDRYEILIYHKCDGINTQTVKGYGRRSDNMTETANMALLLFAFRRKVRKPIDWFEASIKKVMPRSIDQTGVVSYSSSFDTLGLMTREWIGITMNYPDVSGMEIKYTLKNTGARCFQPCLPQLV